MHHLCVSVQWPRGRQRADSGENAAAGDFGLSLSGLLYTGKESEAILRNLIAASCGEEGGVQYV